MKFILLNMYMLWFKFVFWFENFQTSLIFIFSLVLGQGDESETKEKKFKKLTVLQIFKPKKHLTRAKYVHNMKVERMCFVCKTLLVQGSK